MPIPKRQTGAGVGAGAVIALALTLATPQIKQFEGRRNLPYYDIVNVLTVCDGHTGSDIVVKKVYTSDECEALTSADAQKVAGAVLKTSPHLAYHPYQLAAAISFSYNVGTGTYAKSTVAKLFNQGDFKGACNFLPKYSYAGGKFVQGLANRRLEEQKLCLSNLTASGAQLETT